jgi:ABC-2 type transport system permease protein
MLGDAIAAETYKFMRNRSTLFWGFCAVPLGLLLYNLGLDTYLKVHGSGLNPLSALAMLLRVDLGRQVLRALDLSSSSFIKIFFAVGAAGLFGNEYRWETWRLLTPRNSRANLLIAKAIVYLLACAASLVALALVAVACGFYNAVLNGGSLIIEPGFAITALSIFLINWTELAVLGLFVALVAVASRVTTGALMAGVIFAFAQGIAISIIPMWDAPLRDFGFLPALCAELLRSWVSGAQIAPGVTADPAKVLPAALFLGAWIVLLGAAALVRFQRQDLPRE